MARAASVLHVVLSLSPGGTERLVVEMVRRRRSSQPMAVCCLDGPGLWGEELRAEGVPLTALHRGPGFQPALGAQIARIARSHGATVLHCHHYSPFVYGCLARLHDASLRVVFTEHGRLNDAPPSRKRRLVNTVLSRVPHRIYAVSANLRGHLVAEGFPADRTGVILNGIDPLGAPTSEAEQAARRSLGVAADAFVVGAVGRLDPVKGLPVLIRAFDALAPRMPGAVLVLVGDGPERAALEQQASACGAADRIRFAGHRADVRQLLPAFDVLVNSSIYEGVSLTILEAMAAERPIVATAVGGTPEVVVDGTTGLLIPPDSPAALERALSEVAGRPGQAREMGRAARRRVLEQFTLDRMVGAYADIYEQVQERTRCAA